MLLTQPVQWHTEDHTFQADSSTTNGHHGDLFSGSSDDEAAQLDGSSSGGSSHVSESNNAGADQSSRPEYTASTPTAEQADTGNNQWSLQQHPLDLLGIPRSVMTTPVSSRSTSAAGRSAQKTPNSAPGRLAGPEPVNHSPNAQGGIYDPRSDGFPGSS